MAYITNTYLLELTKALVINPPRGIRNISEKTSILQFPELTPNTWVGRDLKVLEAFARRYDQVVLKILFMMGGEGDQTRRERSGISEKVARVSPPLAVNRSSHRNSCPRSPAAISACSYLNGEPFAALRRLPKAGDFRANLAVGGQAAAGELDAADHAIAAAVAPLLKREGIVFAGLDVIAGKLIEINVTSPTLAQELRRLSGLDLPKAFWDRVETLF